MTLTEPETYIELGAPLTDTHDSVWQRLGQCGTWWSGKERVAAMAEVRQAFCCALCIERLEALSPMMIRGEHDSVSDLPREAVDLIHRLATDPGRLSKEWALLVIESIGEEPYVELATLVCVQYVIDSFARSLGLPLRELPEPQPGEPDRVRPEGVGDVERGTLATGRPRYEGNSGSSLFTPADSHALPSPAPSRSGLRPSMSVRPRKRNKITRAKPVKNG